MGNNVYEEWNEEGNLEKIKECPFCGEKGILCDNGYEQIEIDPETGAYTGMDYEEADIFWCECEKCGALAEAGDSPEKAISNWNRRTLNAQGMTAKEALKIGEEIYKGIQAGIASVHGDTNNRKEG